MKINTIVQGDCVDVMQQMPEGCCNLIFADPPYNLNKAKWDNGHDWQEWIKQAIRVLAFNGAMWITHRSARELAKISEFIEQSGGPPFKNWITWDLYNGAQNKPFLDGYTLSPTNRSFHQMAEYIIYHADDGAWERQCDRQRGFIFEPIRAYLAGEFERAGVHIKKANEYCGVASVASGHFFAKSQFCMPTKKHYKSLQRGLNEGREKEYLRREYEDLRREYEDLRREYEDLRPTFNNPGYVSSVWQGPASKKNFHETPKPEWLLARIINTTSNEGDLVFDPFMGSGTTAVVADRLKRKWYGCDQNQEYVDKAMERVRLSRIQKRLL